jgi:hypothetical protein
MAYSLKTDEDKFCLQSLFKKMMPQDDEEAIEILITIYLALTFIFVILCAYIFKILHRHLVFWFQLKFFSLSCGTHLYSISPSRTSVISKGC